jgi:hypothetical protein
MIFPGLDVITGSSRSLLCRQRRFALGEGGLGSGKVGRAEAGVDFHRAPGVGQSLGGLTLPHEGFGQVVVVEGDQFLAVDGFG